MCYRTDPQKTLKLLKSSRSMCLYHPVSVEVKLQPYCPRIQPLLRCFTTVVPSNQVLKNGRRVLGCGIWHHRFLCDRGVLTWGDPLAGGDCSAVESQLPGSKVHLLCSGHPLVTEMARSEFVCIRLVEVTRIVGNRGAFAALRRGGGHQSCIELPHRPRRPAGAMKMSTIRCGGLGAPSVRRRHSCCPRASSQ